MATKTHDNKAGNTKFAWHVLDASTRPLGRIATQAAHLLMGKHMTDFAPNKVAPLYVIIINTDKVVLTGDKVNQKQYHKYSGYSGGLHSRTVKEQLTRDSRVVLRNAVSGMLPKNLLRDDRMRHLKLYPGAEHPHVPQTNSK
ncbi:MAG: 50S ribosomal protein L13 [Candidatus Andersenbacteria bacterium]|nr:50S ribosomal protein L13 [Candidatus Andersenbacteria bacterium]